MSCYSLEEERLYTQRRAKPKFEGGNTLTDKQLKQIENQLPEGERFAKAYAAFEGGIRVVSKDKHGREYRYNVSFDANGNASIKRF